jgi:hypothetical protein
VTLRKINIPDTFFLTSSVEAPKLQRPPELFVASTEKTVAEITARKLFTRFKEDNFCMSGTPPSGRPFFCIWWDVKGIIHYELLERNLTVTAERYCQQLRRLEEAIQQ